MNKTTIPIKGMHCRSCEMLIEEKLKEIPEIKSARVSYKKSEATIYSKTQLDLYETAKINRAVEEAGYEVGTNDSKSWISLNGSEYKDLVASAIILYILYFIAKKLGIFNINTGGSASNPSSLFVVLLIGLTAGISTCMALVGGLILGISARHSEKHPDSTPAQKFKPHIYFNLGRIASYFVLGGLVGLAGKAFQLSGTSLGILTILVGSVMLLMGLQLTEMFPRLSNGGLTLPSSISKLFGIKKHNEKEYSHINSTFVGALTFFLPCGFTQAMQLFAMTTGNFWSGALIMGTFAIGTAPGLLGIGGLTSVLKGAFAKKFFKFTGTLVVALAIFNISNGFNLTGWKISLPSAKNSSTQVVDDPNVKIENGIQVVRMDQVGGGYKPNKFTIKKGMPVKWIVTAKSPNACSASIMASKIGVKKILQPGENIIEFTPKETGEIKFSCLMGMYTGKFIVVDNNNSTTQNAQPTQAQTNSPVPPVASNPPALIPTTPPSPDSGTNNLTPSSSTPVETPQQAKDQVQVIKTTFDSVSPGAASDISPNEFTVIVGKPVRFEITANADGAGCMGSITIPGLTKQTDFFEKGKAVTFEFTPTKTGTYEITCAMGVPRGTITVV